MDFSTLPDSALKACLKDAGMTQHHPEIQKILAVRQQKPKVTVPEDQKVMVNVDGFSSVVYLNKNYLAPVAYKGRRVFGDSKFGGHPVLRLEELKGLQKVIAKAIEVIEANPVQE